MNAIRFNRFKGATLVAAVLSFAPYFCLAGATRFAPHFDVVGSNCFADFDCPKLPTNKVGENKEILDVAGSSYKTEATVDPRTRKSTPSKFVYDEEKYFWGTSNNPKFDKILTPNAYAPTVDIDDKTVWIENNIPELFIYPGFKHKGSQSCDKIGFDNQEKAEAFVTLMQGNDFAQLRFYKPKEQSKYENHFECDNFSPKEVQIKVAGAKDFITLDQYLKEKAPTSVEKMEATAVQFGSSALNQAARIYQGLAKELSESKPSQTDRETERRLSHSGSPK